METVQHALQRFGPGRCDALGLADARRYCLELTHAHSENFSVLSALVPAERVDDFAAVYAFCRWADDLSDESGSPERALELLGWWRQELAACVAGQPRHPVFVALRPVMERASLPAEPFERLIEAFEWDQRSNRWATWEELLRYCRGSADPVGRLVLMVLGESRDESVMTLSDRTCTALQLTNHWQDVRRDLLERNRIYVPRELTASIPDFEARLLITARQGWAPDREFLAAWRPVLRECVERTWRLFDEGDALLDHLSPAARPVVWLFGAGGRHVLRSVERWGFETCLARPRLTKARKALLVARAWWMARRRAAAPAAGAALPARHEAAA
ncbi:MAG: squalene synthase HpnC [Phycisphaerales bacterium]